MKRKYVVPPRGPDNFIIRGPLIDGKMLLIGFVAVILWFVIGAIFYY